MSAAAPRRALQLLLAGAMALLVAVPAAADEPVRGNILVPIERVAPGGSFPVTGYQLDPGIELELTLRQGGATAVVGAATVAADGTLRTAGTVPLAFAPGYAELVVTSEAGGQWIASVLVAGPAADPATPTVVDERTVAIAVMGVGLVIFLIAGTIWLRERSRSSSPERERSPRS